MGKAKEWLKWITGDSSAPSANSFIIFGAAVAVLALVAILGPSLW